MFGHDRALRAQRFYFRKQLVHVLGGVFGKQRLARVAARLQVGQGLESHVVQYVYGAAEHIQRDVHAQRPETMQHRYPPWYA